MDKPDLEERLATNPRDQLLIAAALAPKAVGRRLIMLHGEWDGCAKPRRPLPHDIYAIRKTLQGRAPLVLSHKHLDAWPEREARRMANAWYTNERMRVIGRLKSVAAVRRGLTDAAVAKGMENAEAKVLGVLGWWLDPTCPVCSGRKYTTMPGTNRLSNRLCGTTGGGCGGTGERQLPHGADGRTIEAMVGEFIYRARQQINALDKGFTAVRWKQAGAP